VGSGRSIVTAPTRRPDDSSDRFRPDGWGWRARIGVIAPDTDFVPDAELSAMAPEGVSVHATRVQLGFAPDARGDEPIELAALRAYVKPPLIDDAAGLLAAGPASVIAYAFTSTCYLGGDGDDDTLRARLERRTAGTPVVTTCVAAVQAMRALGIERVALVHPPWVSADVGAMGAEYFGRRGLKVVMAGSVALHANPLDLDPRDVYEWVRANTPADASAVFLAGNGFRTVSLVAAWEAELGRPVLTANQVLLWAALRAPDVRSATVAGYGEIFDHLA
jgi:maleate isomerase